MRFCKITIIAAGEANVISFDFELRVCHLYETKFIILAETKIFTRLKFLLGFATADHRYNWLFYIWIVMNCQCI